MQVVLPSGAALEFRVAGGAPAAARALAAGDAVPEVTPELERRGLLSDAPADLVSGLAPPLLAPRAGRLRLEGDGVVAAALREALVELGVVPVAAQGQLARDDLLVLALDAFDAPRLLDANRRALEAGAHLMPVGMLEPRRVVVGPLVVPGETACLACLLARRALNARVRWMDAPAAGAAPPLAVARVAAGLAALDVARHMRGIVATSLGHAVSVGLDGFDGARDRVLKLPRCEACSRHVRTPPVEPWLQLPKEASPRS